jgi:hypothetical protein
MDTESGGAGNNKVDSKIGVYDFLSPQASSLLTLLCLLWPHPPTDLWFLSLTAICSVTIALH